MKRTLAIFGLGVWLYGGFPVAQAAVKPAVSLPACRGWKPYDPKVDATYESYRTRTKRSACQKEWAVLVYMAADNDLEPYAWLDLFEMEADYDSGSRRSGSTAKTDVLVQLDTAAETGTRRFHMMQGPTPYRRLQESNVGVVDATDISSPVVENFEETDSGSPQTLRDFLAWAMREYPAKHYMLILWGHGEGGMSANDRFGGLAADRTQGTKMSVPQLAGVLRETSRELGRPLDVFASDACLLQTVEVATELSGAASDTEDVAVRFLVGSTEITSQAGLPYRRLLYELNSGSFRQEGQRMNSREDEAWLLARMLPQLTLGSFNPNTGNQGKLDPTALETLTLSSISAEELRWSLLPALHAFAREMNTTLEANPVNAIDFQDIFFSVPSYLGGTRDLGAELAVLRNRLNRNPNLGSEELVYATDEALTALNKTILSVAFGSRYVGAGLQSLGFKGLAVWMPQDFDEFTSRLPDYADSAFYSYGEPTGTWPQWLGRLHGR